MNREPLVEGTPDDVERDVKDHMDVLKPGGRWLAGSSHSTVNYTPTRTLSPRSTPLTSMARIDPSQPGRNVMARKATIGLSLLGVAGLAAVTTYTTELKDRQVLDIVKFWISSSSEQGSLARRRNLLCSRWLRRGS